MRTFIFAALAVLAVGLLDARPASAHWKCSGPEYVCGGATRGYETPAPRKARAASHKESKRAKAAHASGRRGYIGETQAKHTRKAASTRLHSYSSASAGGSGSQTGVASYYWQGQRTASGGRFNPNAMTAAHKTLPFGTRVRVTHLGNGRSVDVVINDRGPFVRGRVIDLSKAAAGVIGMQGSGVARVQIAVLGR